MKAKLNYLPALGLAVLFLGSCDLAIPTKLQVKATPTVNAAFGSTDFAMSDYFSVSDVTDAFTSGDASSPMKVYDYIDATDPDTQKFLMHMNVMEMPIDMNEYLGNLDISGDLTLDLQSQNIVVPAVGFTSGNTMNFNVSSVIQTSLDSVSAVTTAAPELGSNPPVTTVTIPAPTLSISGFSTVTFGSGSLDFDFSVPATAPTDYTLDITNVSILDASDDSVIASGSGTADATSTVAASRTISIDLADVVLPNQIKISVTATSEGGTIGNSQDLTVTPSFTNTTVTEATGFTVNEEFPISLPGTSLGDMTTLVEATIGTGQINLVVASLPNTVSGVARTLDLHIYQGSSDIYNQTGVTLDGLTDNTLVIPLAGQTITGDPITVDGKVYIQGDPASTSATALNVAADPLTWEVSSDITLFSSITLTGIDAFGTEEKFSEPVDSSSALYQWVDYILFDKVGLNINYTNGLPAGNDLTLTVNSAAFGIANQSGSLTGGSTNVDLAIINDSGDTGRDDTSGDYTFDPQTLGVDGIDFSVSLLPPGYSAGEFTLTNIEPDTTYPFSVNSVDVVSDWSDASITPATAFAGVYPETTADAIDLSMLTEYLGTGLSFSEIGALLYIGGNSALDSLALEGVLQAEYHIAGSSVAQTKYLQNPTDTTDATPASLAFGASPDLPDVTVYDDGTDTPLPAPTLDISTALKEVFDANPTDLRLRYDISATGLVLNYASLTDNAMISVDLVLILPLELAVDPLGGDIALDQFLAPDGGTQEDLFGRAAGETDETIDTALDSLASMSLDFTLINRSGIGGSFSLIGSNGFNATFTLSSDVAEQPVHIGLTQENLLAMKTAPFTFDTLKIVPEDDGSGTPTIAVNRASVPDEKTIVVSQIKASIATAVDQTIEF